MLDFAALPDNPALAWAVLVTSALVAFSPILAERWRAIREATVERRRRRDVELLAALRPDDVEWLAAHGWRPAVVANSWPTGVDYRPDLLTVEGALRRGLF